MKVSIPLYIVAHTPTGSGTVRYDLRPLFFDEVTRTDDDLGRGTRALVTELQKLMTKMATRGEHRQLAEWCFCPDLEHHRYRLDISLRTSFIRQAFSVVTLRAFDRRIGMVPTIPGFWFEILRDEGLRERAEELLTEEFQRREKDGDNLEQLREWWGLAGKAWVTTVDFDIETKQKVQSFDESLMSFMTSGEPMDGATELDRTGRCLDRLYPEDLNRCMHRESLVEEIMRLLTAPDRRPILLVGPPGAGKTTLIHEYIYRRLQQNQARFRTKENVWLLSPQRLISGMSFVGQWENRFIEILKHARKRRHILYFDDLIGLFRAGVSRDSDLCVADLLKAQLEQRTVRVLAETTPEALRRLRELDRSFADQFHIVRVDEPTQETTVLILLETIRQLERRHGCQFGVDVVPTVTDLCRRFMRGAAFPGKAARLLRQTATKNARAAIARGKILKDFRESSGLNAAFVDSSDRLQRDSVIAGLREMMVGQDVAIEAAADVISVARARLNDAERPFGSFLFLGPTGVGKTQCARAIANYLFGDSERLVRFDMNEFITPDAVSRLVGTAGSPEGLLTSAIRRQPFSVVLLDEIEKAHPDAYDLFLQVLGDGRLTDSLGRTADFTSTIVIMTSNLGSRESQSTMGFVRSDNERTHAFVRAAEKFFRPEFFNRIDHVVPFDPLNRDQVRQIARRHIEELCLREGLLRRRCVLHPKDSVADAVIEAGFEPKWGARGVRRFIESQILRPIGVELAAHAAIRPTVVTVEMRNSNAKVSIEELVDVERSSDTVGSVTLTEPEDAIDRLTQCLERLEERCEAARPAVAYSTGNIEPEQYYYLEVSECLSALRNYVRQLRDQRDDQLHHRIADAGGLAGAAISNRRSRRFHDWNLNGGPHDQKVMPEMLAVDDIGAYVRDALSGEFAYETSEWHQVVRKFALMEAVVPRDERWNDQSVILIIRSLQLAPNELHRFFVSYARLGEFPIQGEPDAKDGVCFSLSRTLLVSQESRFEERFVQLQILSDGQVSDEIQRKCRKLNCIAMQFDGLCAETLLASELGTHLVVQPNGRLLPFQLVGVPLTDETSAESVLERTIAELNDADGSVEDCLFKLQPVVRVHGSGSSILDIRTGRSSDLTETLMTSALPVPPELLPAVSGSFDSATKETE